MSTFTKVADKSGGLFIKNYPKKYLASFKVWRIVLPATHNIMYVFVCMSWRISYTLYLTVFLFLSMSLSVSVSVSLSLYNRDIGPAVRVFANGPGDLGSIPGLSHTKDFKNGTWYHLA